MDKIVSANYLPKFNLKSDFITHLSEVVDRIINNDPPNGEWDPRAIGLLTNWKSEFEDILDKYRKFFAIADEAAAELIREFGYSYLLGVLEKSEVDLEDFKPLMTLLHFLKGSERGMLLVVQMLGFEMDESFTEEWWEVLPQEFWGRPVMPDPVNFPGDPGWWADPRWGNSSYGDEFNISNRRRVDTFRLWLSGRIPGQRRAEDTLFRRRYKLDWDPIPYSSVASYNRQILAEGGAYNVVRNEFRITEETELLQDTFIEVQYMTRYEVLYRRDVVTVPLTGQASFLLNPDALPDSEMVFRSGSLIPLDKTSVNNGYLVVDPSITLMAGDVLDIRYFSNLSGVTPYEKKVTVGPPPFSRTIPLGVELLNKEAVFVFRNGLKVYLSEYDIDGENLVLSSGVSAAPGDVFFIKYYDGYQGFYGDVINIETADSITISRAFVSAMKEFCRDYVYPVLEDIVVHSTCPGTSYSIGANDCEVVAEVDNMLPVYAVAQDYGGCDCELRLELTIDSGI